MPSCMVTLRRRSIWSNFLGILFGGRIWYASSKRRYIVLGKIHEPCWISSAVSSLKWGFKSAISTFDHSVFMHMSPGTVILAVYIDDILLTESDADGIEKPKEYLKTSFVTKYMSKPRYFFRIEIAHSKHVLSQRKYALYVL